MSRFNLTGWTDVYSIWCEVTKQLAISVLGSSRHNVLHRFDGDHIQFNGNCSTVYCIITSSINSYLLYWQQPVNIVLFKVLYPTIWYSNKLKMRIIIGYFNPIRRVLYVLQNKITECLLFKNGSFVFSGLSYFGCLPPKIRPMFPHSKQKQMSTKKPHSFNMTLSFFT